METDSFLDVDTQLMFSTVRIVVNTATGGEGYGTGFFFKWQLGTNRPNHFLVTNKHVVEGCRSGRIIVHKADRLGRYLPFDFSQSLQDRFIQLDLPQCDEWIPHPDSSVDLCALSFESYLEDANLKQEGIFMVGFASQHILPDSELLRRGPINDVLMIGYPNALWDDVNNLPLIRKGITATHPGLDYRGKSQSVLDIACFPGSSGSPVVMTEAGIDGSLASQSKRSVLLGVLFAGPEITVEGDIVVRDVPTVATPLSSIQMMMHLGHIVKAKELLTFESYLRTYVF